MFFSLPCLVLSCRSLQGWSLGGSWQIGLIVFYIFASPACKNKGYWNYFTRFFAFFFLHL